MYKSYQLTFRLEYTNTDRMISCATGYISDLARRSEQTGQTNVIDLSPMRFSSARGMAPDADQVSISFYQNDTLKASDGEEADGAITIDIRGERGVLSSQTVLKYVVSGLGNSVLA